MTDDFNNKDELNMKRLEEDLIYSIRKFQQYAKMYPFDRNIYIAHILEELLLEVREMQMKETRLDTL